MTRLRLLVINPNATASMTRTIAEAVRRALGDAADVVAMTNHAGPPAIEGAEDGERAVPGVLSLLAANPDHDAAIIACFDDTGLGAARAASPRPVLGLGEAAFMAAALRGPRFSVVTSVPEAIPVIEDNLRVAGLAARCARVRAARVRVLDIERDPVHAAACIAAEADRAFCEDRIASVVLGCAGMTGLGGQLAGRFDGRLVDCVRAAALMAHAAVGATLSPPRCAPLSAAPVAPA